jgi:putative spermidine/putrescine transport system substrate-binding protein
LADHEKPEPLIDTTMSRRQLLQLGMGMTVGMLGAGTLGSLLAGPASAAARVQHAAKNPFASGNPIPLDILIKGAKAEKVINTIALPPDWANYGAVMSTFQKKYGLKLNNEAPDDSSGQEIQALISYRHNASLEPDAVDVGPSFAAAGKAQGLFAPYRNSHWDTIPASLKDPEGYWVGDYYGVIAFGANRDIVKTMPQDWSDLLKPEYKNMVSIDGDPRSASDAFMAVWAAALANGGSLDNIKPGIEFFAELKKRGNFVPVDNYPANIAKGTTPIALKWDYLLLGYIDEFKGNPPLTVVIPKTGVIAGWYAQAISKYSFHPYAARLWEEFLYSDEGQLLWLEGYAHPARFNDLAKRGKIPGWLEKKLPPASAYAKAQFPSVEQTNKAAAVVQKLWGPMVVGA